MYNFYQHVAISQPQKHDMLKTPNFSLYREKVIVTFKNY